MLLARIQNSITPAEPDLPPLPSRSLEMLIWIKTSIAKPGNFGILCLTHVAFAGSKLFVENQGAKIFIPFFGFPAHPTVDHEPRSYLYIPVFVRDAIKMCVQAVSVAKKLHSPLDASILEI